MIAPFIYGSTASLHCAALPYLYSWESGIGRHWCVCRGGACPARPRSGKRTAKSIGCTAVSAVPPDVSLRGGHRPTWQSREGTADLERLSLKWYVPIASVAAVSDRHADWQVIGWHRRPCRLPDLSLRGGRRPTWRPEREARGSALGVQSRSTRLNRGKAIGEIAAAFPRLPRPLWGLAMTHQGSARCTSALTRLNCPVQGAH